MPIQRVSGRKRSTSGALASATSMATQKGTAVPRGASAPPSAGPTTKPNPIAAPMSPIRKGSEEGRKEKLRQGIGRENQADTDRSCPEPLRPEWQQGGG